MRFQFLKMHGTLEAANAAALDALRRFKNGTVVWAELRQPRNPEFHELYWALVHKVFENLPEDSECQTPEELHNAIKIAVGLRRKVYMPSGTEAYMAGSISFAAMDEIEFGQFMSRVFDMVSKYFIPGLPTGDLRKEIEIMVGARSKKESKHYGVCPHCERDFANLERHLASKHPDQTGAPKSKPRGTSTHEAADDLSPEYR